MSDCPAKFNTPDISEYSMCVCLCLYERMHTCMFVYICLCFTFCIYITHVVVLLCFSLQIRHTNRYQYRHEIKRNRRQNLKKNLMQNKIKVNFRILKIDKEFITMKKSI